jgi:hypothetical protein
LTTNSSLGSRIGRAGDILRKATISGLKDYQSRFSSVSGWYESFLKDLIVDNFSDVKAHETARSFFGKDKVNFVAIDGTEYSVQLFDMLVFYAGAYSSEGSIEISTTGMDVTYKDRFMDQGKDVSTCVPIYINKIPEIDQTFNDINQVEQNIMKPLTEETILDNTNIANSLMTFSEYYLAYLAAASRNFDIILMDRSLSNTYSSLIYDTSTRTTWKDNCSIVDLETDGFQLDINDLTICRHHVVSTELDLPPSRGDYLRYAVLEPLKNNEKLTFECISTILKISGDEKISKRIHRYIEKWIEEGVIDQIGDEFTLKVRYRSSWARLKNTVIAIGSQLFDGENPFTIVKKSGEELLTTLDFAFLTLFSLYMLIEKCWENKILLIGITKDTAAHDFKNHVIPICLNNQVWSSSKMTQNNLDNIPNTDRMFLQSISMSNHNAINVPWALVEYDACFVTAIPDFKNRK